MRTWPMRLDHGRLIMASHPDRAPKGPTDQATGFVIPDTIRDPRSPGLRVGARNDSLFMVRFPSSL